MPAGAAYSVNGIIDVAWALASYLDKPNAKSLPRGLIINCIATPSLKRRCVAFRWRIYVPHVFILVAVAVHRLRLGLGLCSDSRLNHWALR